VPQSIFSERGLALVAVPWPWAIAFKLVRYAKQDPTDCAAVLRLVVAQRGIYWTLAGLEQWIMERCWPMGYMGYQPPQEQQLRQRIQEALNRAFPPGSHGMPVARTTSKTPVYFSQTDKDRSTPIDSFTAFLGRSSDAARRSFLSCLSISTQVIVHLSHLKSLLRLSLSLSLLPSLGLSETRFRSRIQGAMLSCHAVLIVPSHFSYNQGSDTIDHPITLFVP